MLFSAVPRDLPAAVRRRARDRRIKTLGVSLRGAIPGISTYEVARLPAAAGASIDGGHRSAVQELPMLAVDELAQVDSEILEILGYSPARQDGARWPRWRQIFAIIGP